MNMLMFLQNVVFPIVNVGASCFTLGAAWWHYRMFGSLPKAVGFPLPVVAWFGLIYILFLAGIVEVPAVFLRGTVVVLLLTPGIIAYIRIMEAKRNGLE